MKLLRETYKLSFPVILLFSLLICSTSVKAQENILDREINLSRTTGEIDFLLRELASKGDFSFTYTSIIQSNRIASVTLNKQMVRDHLKDIFRFDSIDFIEQNNKILLVPRWDNNDEQIQYRLITGLVIDARNRRPLTFANVFLLNKSVGTISNAGGRFELKLSEYSSDDTLGISYMGYKLYKIPLEKIDTSNLIARLTSERVQIRETIVRPFDPIYIITKALENIRLNFGQKQSVLTAFFRETTKQDNKNISLSEAVINIYKEPYLSNREDQVKLSKGRKGSNTDNKEYIDFLVQGGLYNSLQLDIVKNPPTFLDADYFALYNYEVDKIITHFERPTYVISFDQKPDVRYPCFKGYLYVDVESFAIVGASFELNEKNLNYNPREYIKKNPRTIRVNPTAAYYEVYYRRYDGIWNLSNARSEIQVHVRQRKDQGQDRFNSDFASVSEFVITSKDTLDVTRFKMNETSKPKDILEEQIGDADPDFWGNENIIIPEEPIVKTILFLVRRNSFFTDEEIELIKIQEEIDALQELETNIEESPMNADSLSD